MKNIMKEAHRMTKEIKKEFPNVDYKFQLGLCISYLYENEKKENVEMEFSKNGIDFNFKDWRVDKYNNFTFSYKVSCDINKTSDGYYHNGKLDERRKVALISFKYNKKKMNGVSLSEELLAEMKAIKDKLISERKELIKDTVNKIVSGEIKIVFKEVGSEYKTIIAWVDDIPDPLKGQEIDLMEKAIKVYNKDFYGDACAYIKNRSKVNKACEMTLEDALNMNEIIKKREERENKIKDIFKKAKDTGVKQEIRHWSEECNDPNEDCDIDIITEYAMPDGTKKVVRSHTW